MSLLPCSCRPVVLSVLVGFLFVAWPVAGLEAATPAEVTPRWEVGSAWTVELRVMDETPSIPAWRPPVLLTCVVYDEAVVDGEQAWLLLVFDHTFETTLASAWFRKSDMRFLRLRSGPPAGNAGTLDFVAEAGTAVLLDQPNPPLDFPFFGSGNSADEYEYVPVINETWGFPLSVAQSCEPTDRGVAISLRRDDRTVRQEWEPEKPWWTRAEESGKFLAETVEYFTIETGATASAAEAPEPAAIERRLVPPTSTWWPMTAEADVRPWSPGEDSASATAIPNPSGSAARTPWSGFWWPASYSNDVNVNTYASGGLLYKYDEVYRILKGAYPSHQKARDWELANYALDPSDPGAGWTGHCNGWAAAAILKPEPTSSRTVSGFTFDVGDLKGLLSEAYFLCDSVTACGRRYNGASTDVLTDPTPYDFHRSIVQYLGVEHRAVVFDVNRNVEVWNYPAYRYEMTTTRDTYVSGRLHVTCQVWFADDAVHADALGTKVYGPRTYRYYLAVDAYDNPIQGSNAWEGTASNYSNPDFIWVPVGTGSEQRPWSGSERIDPNGRWTHNPALYWDVVRTIVGSGPVVTYFALDKGASTTTNPIATMDNTCTGSPTHFMLGGDQSFAGGVWQTYSTAPRVYLSSGSSTYTVWFKVKDATGLESAPVSDTITLSESPIVTLTVNAAAVTGTVSPAGDADWYQFTAPSAGTYRIETWAGTLVDNLMYLWGPNSKETLMELDDDDGAGDAAMIERSLLAGTYYVLMMGIDATVSGTYTIRVTSATAAPAVSSFALNNGASSTATRWVTLDNTCTGSPVSYMASESSDWSAASWQTYSTSPEHVLRVGGSGAMTRTVYFKVKNAAGQESGTVSDTITLSEPVVTALTVNASAASGEISPGGEVDWYRFTVASAGTHRIETWGGSLLDTFMMLYGPDSQTAFVEEDDDDGEGNAAMIERALTAGTWYVAVKAFNPATTGTYTVRVTGGAVAPSVTSFAINGGASSTTSATVTLNNACSGSPTQYLASESASFTGAAWQSWSAAPAFKLSEGTGAKTVYFKVRNATGQESGVSSDTITVAVEAPIALTVDGPVVEGNIESDGEYDWYRFDADAARYYRIETWPGSLADNAMSLHGPNSQNALLATDDDSGTGNAAMIERPLSAGAYWVRISASMPGGRGTYTIRVTSVAPAPVVTAFRISNGAASTAERTVTLDNTCTGNPVQYAASESPSFAGAIWQSYATAPQFTLSAGAGTKTVYFLVRSADGQQSAVVSDAISLTEVVGTTLTVGAKAMLASIDSRGEEDWYRFAVGSAGVVRIETKGKKLKDTYMILFGPGGTSVQIASDDDSGKGKAAMVIRSLEPGTYYVMVRAYSASLVGTYTIAVTR